MRSRGFLPPRTGTRECWSTRSIQGGSVRTWAVRRRLDLRRRAPTRLCGWPRCRRAARPADSSAIAAPSNGKPPCSQGRARILQDRSIRVCVSSWTEQSFDRPAFVHNTAPCIEHLSFVWLSASFVLLVGDLLEPLDSLAIELLL